MRKAPRLVLLVGFLAVGPRKHAWHSRRDSNPHSPPLKYLLPTPPAKGFSFKTALTQKLCREISEKSRTPEPLFYGAFRFETAPPLRKTICSGRDSGPARLWVEEVTLLCCHRHNLLIGFKFWTRLSCYLRITHRGVSHEHMSSNSAEDTPREQVKAVRYAIGSR